MRITNATTLRDAMNALNQSRARMARVQEQIATGLRINRPSDDPIGYEKTKSLKSSLGQTNQFMRQVDSIRARHGSVENALGEVLDVLSQAKVLAIGAANATNESDESRAMLRSQVEVLFDRLVAAGNTRSPEGAFVFSGVASETPAFAASGGFTPGSAAPTVVFQGSTSVVRVEVDEDVFVRASVSGIEAFQGAADAFGALTRLWTGLDQGDASEIGASIEDLGASFDQANVAVTRLGGEGAEADRIEERHRVRLEQLASRISNLENADALETYSELAAQETALQATLQTTPRLLRLNLLEFI